MKSLAIIPAKAKSNRLPGKNTKPLCGKPLYEYTVDAALESGIFDEIILSTNSHEIIEQEKRIKIRRRPPHLAEDDATMKDVCLYHLEYHKCDSFCVLYPTAPLRTADDIKKSYELFMEDGYYDGVIGGTEYIQPWWQAFEQYWGKVWFSTYGSMVEYREDQIRDKRLVDNGAMYWMKTDVFLRKKTFFPCRLGIYQMPFERSIDINTEVDFRLAEFFIKNLLYFEKE